ncbi:MAG: ABC transporter permease subunit [Spirochaetales bacterium]|nr:ABC transporter permease subunit [Spirochaetales bacterium]
MKKNMNKSGKGFLHEINKNKVLYLMFLPTAIWYLLFRYLPMAGIVVAFKNFNYRDGLFFSPWIGLKNFEYLFNSGKLWSVTQNTIVYNVSFLALYLFFSMFIAILLNEINNKHFKKITQSMLILPYFVSWVVVSAFVYNFFNFEHGIVNNLLESIGMGRVNLVTQAEVWPFLLSFLYIWKWIGFGSVIYLAAISGISQEHYEAAKIDGANAFQQIFYITLPELKSTTIILALLGLGRVMRGEFDMFYNLIGNNGLLMDKTDIIDTMVFRALMGSSDFGMASAGAFYQSVLCFIIILTSNYLVKKYEASSALF